MKITSTTRARTVLTARAIENLKPADKAYRVPDARCGGLAARVAPSGAITFDLAYRVAKTKIYRRLSLGSFPEITLEAARDRAHELTRAARAGIDILASEAGATSAAAARITLGDLAEKYLARKVRGRLRTDVEIERRLARTIITLKDRFADEVQRRDLRELLDTVADAGLWREVEHRRVCLNGLFSWAVSQDHVPINPMHGLQPYGHLEPRKRVLNPDEIQTLWNWLGAGVIREDQADVLKVQLCLGARVSEVGGMLQSEFDTDAWIWTLPAARSKNGKPRTTPIVGIAREIIASRLERGQLFAAENGVPIRAGHVSITLRDHPPPIEQMTSHDLRRTAATEMAEALGLPLETIARVLGHVAGGAATRVLTTHYVNAAEFIEQKTYALSAWDGRLRSIIRGDIVPAANVVALTEARRAPV